MAVTFTNKDALVKALQSIALTIEVADHIIEELGLDVWASKPYRQKRAPKVIAPAPASVVAVPAKAFDLMQSLKDATKPTKKEITIVMPEETP
jgi:hypothetical protein